MHGPVTAATRVGIILRDGYVRSPTQTGGFPLCISVL